MTRVAPALNLDREYIPQTFPEAVLWADRWYHDSGFNAYLEGWSHCAKNPLRAFWPRAERTQRGSGYIDRRQLIKWATRQVTPEEVP